MFETLKTEDKPAKPAPIVPPAPVDIPAAEKEFRRLYAIFIRGSKWNCEMRLKFPIGKNPSFESDLWRFDNEVVKPMEEAWAKLPAEIKERIIKETSK